MESTRAFLKDLAKADIRAMILSSLADYGPSAKLWAMNFGSVALLKSSGTFQKETDRFQGPCNLRTWTLKACKAMAFRALLKGFGPSSYVLRVQEGTTSSQD